MPGSLQIEMPAGRRFALGSRRSDVLSHNPPQVGTLVAYRYPEPTRQGIRRLPSNLRVREPF